MTCRELNDFLADYHSGDLAPEVRSRFAGHLLGCPACVAYMRSYERTVRLVQDAGSSLDQQLLPPDVPEQLVTAILESTIGRATSPPPPPFLTRRARGTAPTGPCSGSRAAWRP